MVQYNEEFTKVELSAEEIDDGIRYIIEKDGLETFFDLKRYDNPIEIDKVQNIIEVDLGGINLKSNEDGEVILSYNGERVIKDNIPLGNIIVIDDQEIKVKVKNMPHRLSF